MAMSKFTCDSGCCGETDNEYCCGEDSGGINKEALPYVIGCSIFGALVFIGVTIFLVWVFRKVCRELKVQSENRQMYRETEQLAQATFNELFSTNSETTHPSPHTVVHDMTVVNAPPFSSGNESLHESDPAPDSSSLRRGRHDNNSRGFGDYRHGNDDGRMTWSADAPEEVAMGTGMPAHSQHRSANRDQGGGGARPPSYHAQFSDPPPAYDEVMKGSATNSRPDFV